MKFQGIETFTVLQYIIAWLPKSRYFENKYDINFNVSFSKIVFYLIFVPVFFISSSLRCYD